MDNSSIKNRIEIFCKEMRISQRKFEKSCGFGYGFISHIKTYFLPSSILSIEVTYPNLNIEWLLNGKRDMINHSALQRISNDGADVSGTKGYLFLATAALPCHAIKAIWMI